MSRRRQSGLFTGRISHNTLMWQQMVGLILVFFLNGNSCWQFIKDVKYPSLISAWEGSCALLKCEYVRSSTNYQLTNLTWYKDPLYNNLHEIKWTGTIVFTHVKGQMEINQFFGSRAQFLGDLKTDCTLLIKDLLVSDSGNYSVRLEDGNEKWMSKPYLNLNVSVSPPEPRIEVLSRIRESQGATVTCSVDHSCHEKYPIELHWDAPMKAWNKTAYDKTAAVWRVKNTLTFVASWEHNKKPLRCYLSSSEGSTKTSASEIVLDVEHAPKFVQVIAVEPSPTIMEGESVTLRCHVNCSNPPVKEYRWFKDNSIQTQSVPTMQITGASAKDAGNYSCEASNDIGTERSQPLEVVVHFAPKDAQVKKNVAENIIEGTSVTLSCTTECSPPAKGYDWYKDAHHLSNLGKDLKFQEIGADDSGYYRCNVYCPMGNISSPEEYVNVMYAPKKVALFIRSPDPDLIKEGDSVRLTCTYSSSNPEASEFSWYFNGVTRQTANNEIEIQQIKLAEAGQYSCAVGNKAGLSRSPAVPVDVKYAPKNVIVQVAAPSTLQEGHYAEINCHVGESNPIVNKYKWFKDDHIYDDLQGSKLFFPELKSSDSGSYSCEAVNDIDATKSQPLQVTVQYAPRNVVVSVDPPTRITEDSNISLICSCDAEPAADRYTWYKMSRFYLNTKERRLLIYRITREQSGPYQCEAKNSIAYRRSDALTLAVHYNSKTIGKMVAISAGLVVFLLLIVVVLRFRLWKKLQRPKIFTGGESDDRSDTFFVVNRKQSPEDHQDELNNPAVTTDPEYEESTSYAGIQFPSNHVKWETMPPRGCVSNGSSVTLKNKEESPIYSLMQKPSKPPQQTQAVSQDGFGNTAMSLDPEKDESINYSIIQFLPKTPSDEAALTSARTNNRRSVTLKSNEESSIYSVVQKPCKPLQAKEPSVDYENVYKKTEEDIEYCTITNLKCKPTNENESDSESDFEDMGAQYAELKQ